MSDSVRPHIRQPTNLHRPWDSPGKNTGVGCHFLLQCMKVKSESEISQSDPQRPHGLRPSRLLHPWDFPGKNAKVNLLIAAKLVNIIIYIYIYAIKYNIWTHIFYSIKVYFIPVNRIFMHLYYQFSAT